MSAPIGLEPYLFLLAVGGTLVFLGVPPEPYSLNAYSLIAGRRSIAGSLIGGIRETQELLEFCAEHGITPEIELITADQIDEAWERVLRSDVRFRFVIDVSTMKPPTD